jgi:hypothetical protein
MDLKDLHVGDLVKFHDGGHYMWLKTESEMEEGTGDISNVGIVTQIINPVPERDEFIGSDAPEDLAEFEIPKQREIKALTAEIRRDNPELDAQRKIQNICFIYHLNGEGTKDSPIAHSLWSLQHSKVYNIVGSDKVQHGDLNVEKLSHEEFKRFNEKYDDFFLEKMEEWVNENDTDPEGEVLDIMNFGELIDKYANDPLKVRDTASSSSGMSTRKKAMIGAAGLAGLGAVALGNYLSGGKKKRRKTKRKKTKRRRTKRRRTKKKKY